MRLLGGAPGRRAGAAAAVAGVVLLVAPAPVAMAQEAPATGTAMTGITGVDLRLGDLPEVAGVSDGGVVELVVGQLVTLATTDPALDLNPLDAPFAAAGVVPIRANGTAIGATEVRSDGSGGATVGPQAFNAAALDAATAAQELAGVLTEAVDLRATADATSATAAIDALAGQVAALLGGVGLDLDLTAARATVDATAARASQGVTVDGVVLQLGDLVPEQLLGQLPLGDVLDLLEAAGLPVPGELAAALSNLTDQLDAVEAAADELVADARAVAAAAQQAQGLAAGLQQATSSRAAVQRTVADLTGAIPGLTGADRTAAESELASANDQLAALDDTLTSLGSQLDDVLATLPADVSVLSDGLDDLAAALDGLGVVLPELDTDLAALLDQLDDLAATSLVAVDGLTIGTEAVAGPTLDVSSATLVCSSATVTLLGQALPALPSCDEGLDAVRGALDVVPGDLAPVAALLEDLPLDLPLGDLELELFGIAEREVTQEGSTVVSRAQLEVLRLSVPSLSLAPCDAVAQLCELGLPDLEALVGDALADAVTAVQTAQDALAEAGLGDLAEPLAALGDLSTQLTDLGAQLVTLDAVLDGLDLGDFGSLAEGVRTPSIDLVVDPQASASFTPGQAAGQAAPPPLPATGGGAVLLGVGALAAAALLRPRRRPRSSA